jgi:ADP-heptose:LPS heptosyltransferase
VCESGIDFYRGHPILHKRAFDNWHKNLFETYLKNRDIITPEPYKVWEYFNQKCNITQAFDIIINNKGIRELPKPKIYLNKTEAAQGYNIVREIEKTTGLKKTVVIQPFGRGVQQAGEFIIDPGSRSFNLADITEIVDALREDYSIIIMSEFPVKIASAKSTLPPVAIPHISDLRTWAAVIGATDHFLGCDSVGQHIAYALAKSATVVCGSTYPENVSYPGEDSFDIIDVGKAKRVYCPIRMSLDDETDRKNDDIMDLTQQQINNIIKTVKTGLGVPVRAQQRQSTCCSANDTVEPAFTFTPNIPKPKLLL